MMQFDSLFIIINAKINQICYLNLYSIYKFDKLLQTKPKL